MQIVVLGSAAGGGHPQWNCHTPASLRAWHEAPGASRRTQASIAVSRDGERWVLINASPDFRQQVLATSALWPRDGLRHSPIAAVVLTSGEIDHIAGLLSMRESQRFTLYGSAPVLDMLRQNPVFDALNDDFVTRLPFTPGAAHDIAGLRIEPFSVPGKVPLFMESRSAGNLAGSAGETLGLAISDGTHAFHYIPGCAAMTDDLRARLRGSALVFFDGTLWRDDELVAAGISHKTGQRMGHMSVDATVAAFSGLGVSRKVFIHVNTTNPILDAHSPERASVAAHGWEVAHDGLEISL
jgi:pyrroloquinoline quinone biosynthesis protein B